MKKVSFLVFNLLAFAFSYAQVMSPISWKTEIKKISSEEYELIFKASIQKKWALYSQHIGEGGPIPTTFIFEPSPAYKLEGEVKELGRNKQEKYDKTFNMKLIKFYDEVVFVQKVIVSDRTQKLNAYVRFMSCDDTRCIPPQKEQFQFEF